MDLHDVVRFSGNLTIDGVSVPVDIKDTAVNNEMYLVHRDRTLYVAYLQQDPTADNPLDDLDSLGNIYTARRCSSHREMLEALGLDQYWAPRFEAPAVVAISAPKVLEALVSDAQFMTRAKEHFGVETDGEAREELWKAYLDPESYHPTYLAYDFPNPPVDEDTFSRQAWLLARRTGKLGNPFAVLLDAYEHSLIKYYPANEGPNCPWDTAHGSGVWVPDSYLEETLWNEVLKVFGARVDTCASNRKYLALLKGEQLSEHTSFEEARDALIQTLGDTFDAEKGFEAVRPKAREFARGACELYSAWCNGECYYVTIEKWKLTRDEDGDLFAKFIDSESGGNIVGGDNAEDSIKEFLSEKLPSMEAAS